MAFKIKDLMINIGSSPKGGAASGACHTQEETVADVGCHDGKMTDAECHDGKKTDIGCHDGKMSDEPGLVDKARFGCPGRHTDIIWCGSQRTYNYGCTGAQTVDGGCPGKRTDDDCPGKHSDQRDCPNDRTELTDCPGRHSDIVIVVRRETDIGICVGRRTDTAGCPGKRSDLTGCPGKHSDMAGCGKHSDQGGWVTDPGEALQELNAIKAQLTAELARVDEAIGEIEDGLQPKTIEQVEELQTKLQEALDELGKMKADLDKK